MYSPEFGDYIGVESAADLKSDIGVQSLGGGSNHRRMKREEEADREYPPPIPWLAHTENQPPHMPWVMKKYYTGDGRLIIKEEKVKRQGFHAHRSNGRLVLNLVPLDDALEEDCEEFNAGEEERSVNDPFSGEGTDVGDEGIVDLRVEETVCDCCTYNVVGVNTCGGFAMTVAATAAPLRPPVHT
ncbi:uncharacterized protein LOC105159027 [Sesamum indicum]|uniref:Uncharacterized protein LOC105159027 n=1 Tax=Sesamum indicum TaxID=4182 RepID=A0A6I9SVG6_SESIN|nr:uncharacterized protein LOC105159027 [Sesamum indicum]